MGMLADPLLWLAVLAANAPDFDFLPGLFLGNESLFHRGAGHSLGGAFVFSAAVFAAALVLTRSWKRALPALLLASALFMSHLVLDLFGRDPSPPHGIQFFWPFSDSYTFWEWHLFPNLERRPFDRSVVSRAVPVVAAELLLLGPLLLAARFWRRRRRSGEGAAS